METVTNVTLNMGLPAYSTVYSVQGDTLTRKVAATLVDTYGAAWPVPSGALCVIRYVKPDGTVGFYDHDEQGDPAYTISGNVVTFTLAAQMLTVPGNVQVQLDFYRANNRRLATFTLMVVVSPEVVADGQIASVDYINALTKVASEIAQQLSIAYGAPRTANTAAAMTNRDYVYVYTGATGGGYTNGHWYFWNGSAWTDGGIYNSAAIVVDKTLTVEDAAADAKAVGDRFGLVDDMVDALATASLSQAGIGAEGYVTFTDGAGGFPVADLTISFAPVQLGTGPASPDNPRTIVTYDGYEVGTAGKNIFDIASVFGNGYINATGGITASAPYSYCQNYVPVKPGTDYCFSGKLVTPGSTSAINAVAYYDADQNFLSRYVPASGVPAQFHTPDNCRYIRFNVTRAYYDKFTIQLEEGTTPTFYEQFAGTTYHMSWSSTGVRVWGGRADFTKGTVTPTWKRVVEDGTQDVADGGAQTNGYCVVFTDAADADLSRASESMCDRRTYASGPVATMAADRFTWRANETTGTPELCVLVPGATNFDDACYALVEQPLTFAYPLAEPETSLQVAAVPVWTLRGINNVWTSADFIGVAYYQDATAIIGDILSAIRRIDSAIDSLDARVTALEQRG